MVIGKIDLREQTLRRHAKKSTAKELNQILTMRVKSGGIVAEHGWNTLNYSIFYFDYY